MTEVIERGHVFCSPLQFKICYDLLVDKVEAVVKELNVWHGEEAQNQRRFQIKSESIALRVSSGCVS